jgi:hypothetical protein
LTFGRRRIFIHWPKLLPTSSIQIRRQTLLLAIRHVKGHSGESVYQVIREYRIQDQVGFFVLDNDSSNDVAVDCILRRLDSGMPEDERKRRRIRCLTHVINLVAKAFLLGGKAETVADELTLAEA